MELPELQQMMEHIGEKKFRAEQIYKWIFSGVTDFDDMTNISAELRAKLKENTVITQPELLRVQKSEADGTQKYLFGFSDGNAVETVFMKYKYGNSVCVSSQAGCRMGCRFCASGIDGLRRNLTAGEIISEVLAAERESGEKINHVVVMGTGEPFDNYGNVAKFIRLLNSPKGFGLSMRNITVSTCGLIPGIEKFARDFPQANLAISLHAPNDEIRNTMMPVNGSYPMKPLLEACRAYTEKTSRRITFEYTLVSGKNDTKEAARELARRLSGMLCHVNLIPLNAVKETGLKGTDRKNAEAFMKVLESKGIPATIRRELGSDIDAACGQLRLAESRKIHPAK